MKWICMKNTARSIPDCCCCSWCVSFYCKLFGIPLFFLFLHESNGFILMPVFMLYPFTLAIFRSVAAPTNFHSKFHNFDFKCAVKQISIQRKTHTNRTAGYLIVMQLSIFIPFAIKQLFYGFSIKIKANFERMQLNNMQFSKLVHLIWFDSIRFECQSLKTMTKTNLIQCEDSFGLWNEPKSEQFVLWAKKKKNKEN